ncbi:putative aldehyde dehydrogenase [Diplocarpon rosae]|nr:putative aldehyde dehydrogenase [Diplocarpon rosae]
MSDLSVELTAPNGKKYTQPTGLFINNEWVESSNGQKLTSINPTYITPAHTYPAEDTEIASVYAATVDDVDTAVAAARKAFKDPSWRDISPTDRGNLMIKLSDLCDANKEILATIETWDNGKTYAESLADIGEVTSVLKYYGGYADKIHGQVIDTGPKKFAYTIKEPVGVCAINMKNITLETGGKSPLLVFEDADLEQAVKWAHIGIMSNQGQICTATSRILVQDSIYDTFISAFKEQVHKVSVVGDPFAETTFQGPQVTKSQYERILGFVKAGKEEGATLVSGGEAFTSGPTSGKGFFISPTVFTGVTPNMKIFREEVFGPFVTIANFKTEEEAIELANDTTYGLGSAVFTQDLTRAHRVAKNIEAGMVWINSSNDSDFRIPFGGVKQSGIGRELGEAGLAGYTQIKSVHVNMGARL